MRISIVTAAFNSSKTIRTTLESVANQSWPNIEHIIIDGGSSDNTLSIVSEFQHVSKVISEKDKGIYDAMNKGIKNASGKVIGFLNSDDWFANDFVIDEIARNFEGTDIDAVYGDLEFVKNEDDNNPRRMWISEEYKDNFFSKGWVPPHPTFYAKLSIYEKFGLFNANLKFAADFDVMCRLIAKEKINTKYLPGTKVKMRLGGATTKNLRNIIKGNIEIYNSLKKNNVEITKFFFFKKILMKLTQFKL
ncbi:MAG: glycosyl transferase [Candidatus Marinimicrobia bacterium]|nr:glycosyl transferase [Candidatus Neomarinimicrobiota bacterium]